MCFDIIIAEDIRFFVSSHLISLYGFALIAIFQYLTQDKTIHLICLILLLLLLSLHD